MVGDRAGDAGTRAALVQAFNDAREAGDAERMAEVALRLPSSQGFSQHPGQVPALVHEAYAAAAAPTARCRLAAALAQAWVYGGDAGRAVAFADEAVSLAGRIGKPTLLAHALDAALLAGGGPTTSPSGCGFRRAWPTTRPTWPSPSCG